MLVDDEVRQCLQDIINEKCFLTQSQINGELKGAFTRQSKNGTDPTKTGTVPTVFSKKQ